MARNELVRYAFNRGLISPLALARVDLKRAAFSAERQENWMPRTLGSMMLRPGTGYIGSSYNDNFARHIEFVRSLASMHILEFSNASMRVWTNDALITRVTTSAAVANGGFPANLGSWTDNDEAGGTSAWVTGGYMGLTGNGTAAAIRDQSVAIGGYAGVEHALRVTIARGPVTIRVGSAAGLDDYVGEATLGTGTHSLSFTPAVDFNIRLMSRLQRITLVDSVEVEAAGVVVLPAPYQTADMDNIRGGTDQLSVDVMFVGCVGYQPRRIERRNSGRSWSVVLYAPDDGPYRIQNTSTQTLTPSVLSGNGTLTSSVPFFQTGHVGAVFRVGSTGQTVTKVIALLNDATDSIRVIGISTDRTITITLTGMTALREVVLQYSTDDATWINVAGKVWVGVDTVEGYVDGLNNQIIYYRLLCTVVGGAGNTTATLSIPTGTIIGIGRVTAYTSTTVVDIEVLKSFGAITASTNWVESLWSDYRGWPTAGALYEGRMMWGGFDAIVGSVSDAFDDMNPDTVGDSGPINRTIGSGPMDTINWVLPLQRLILGAQLSEHSVRSNAFDEPLTPTNFNRKRCSGQGSSNVQAVTVDSHGMFVQRGGTRVFEISFDPQTLDYGSTDITVLNPEVCEPQVKRMAVQRRPDTRVHCILSDGTAAVLVYDQAEQMMCWIKVTTDGVIEDVVVLPGIAGSDEDQVYYSVARTLATGTVRYLEKWALESECQGGTYNKQADSFVYGAAGAPSVAHLEGETVIAWRNGECPEDANGDIQTYVVASGTINLLGSGPWVVGLPYSAWFKSAKLGQTLSRHKNIDSMAPILYNTHPRGLLYGPDFGIMDNLPLMHEGTQVDTDAIYSAYDADAMSFPGTWDTDARLCLKANAPRPCTVLAVVIDGQVT